MPQQMVRQTMFSAGEVDETVWKRTDIEAYLTAAQSMLNMECGTTALAKKRRGTRFAGTDAIVTSYGIFSSSIYEFIDRNDNFYLVLSSDSQFNIFSINLLTRNITHIQTIVTPYTANDLLNIDYTLDNDSLVLAHPDFPPARIYVSNYTTNPVTFAYAALAIYPVPSYDFNDVNYSQSVVSFTSTSTTFTLTLTGNPGFPNPLTTNDWINGEVVSLGKTDAQPIGYGVITGGSVVAGNFVITGTVYLPFAADADMPTIGNQYAIKKPAWSATLGWPAATAFYQNRLWFGRTAALPSTIFGSKINQPANFDVGAGNDVDAIIYTIGQNETGGILWINGGKQLEIYTENFEFACPQDPSVGITPSTFSVRQQSSYGSSEIFKPLTYLNDSYFVTKTGKAIINYHFDGIGLTYKSSNVAFQSSHLVKNPINRALQRSDETSQDNFIYFLNSLDSSIASFQFANEYKLAALTPVQFAEDVQIISIASINNVVYFLKNYPLTSEFIIELFDNAYRLDAVQTKTVAPYSTYPVTLGVVTGLTDYVGYNVYFVFDDQDFGASLDSAGLPAPVDNTGTAYVFNTIGTSLMGDITVGILYLNDVTPMYIFAGNLQSNYYKFITKIYVDFYQSLDFQIDNVQVPYQLFPPAGSSQFVPLTPQTGTYEVSTMDGYNQFKTFSITQSSPFDLQILAIAYQVDAKIIG